MKRILKDYDLNDSWISNGKTVLQGLSWCDGQNNPKSRIDYIFISDKIRYPVNDISLRRAPNVEGTRLSDHLGIWLNICTSENLRGSGYWKLNTTLLNDEKFCDRLRVHIQDEINRLKTEGNNAKIRWEYMKISIKNFSMTYSRNISSKNKNRIRFIENEIKLLESKQYSEINMNYKRILEKEIDDYYAKKSDGAYVRSRAIWMEKGEKSTSYFLSLKKKQQTNNTIHKVKDDSGTVVNDNNGIMKRLVDFYSSLYSSRKISTVDIENYLLNIECKQITVHEQKSCDIIPTLSECRKAVSRMKNNKSPGQDGLPVEFYKVFWNDVKEIYYESLVESIESGIMPFSQRTAIISLIYKKGEKENLKKL